MSSYYEWQSSFQSQVYLLAEDLIKTILYLMNGSQCFYVGISPDSKTGTGYRIKISFQIGLHEKDLALLYWIKIFFG